MKPGHSVFHGFSAAAIDEVSRLRSKNAEQARRRSSNSYMADQGPVRQIVCNHRHFQQNRSRVKKAFDGLSAN